MFSRWEEGDGWDTKWIELDQKKSNLELSL